MTRNLIWLIGGPPVSPFSKNGYYREVHVYFARSPDSASGEVELELELELEVEVEVEEGGDGDGLGPQRAILLL
jgi:hypothetical protein